MARKPREKKLYSNYHIKQTGQIENVIFFNDYDRKVFLETLKKVKDKYNFLLYGVAISTNGYELILYDNGNDISKIMKSLNISFAMQYKAVHKECNCVFKERYKSEILDKNKLSEAFEALPLCVYIDSKLIDKLNGDISVYNKLCIDCFNKSQEKLSEVVKGNGKNIEEMLSDKKWRNSLIKDFRKNSTLTLSEIGDLFGGLSESTICKILNKC